MEAKAARLGATQRLGEEAAVRAALEGDFNREAERRAEVARAALAEAEAVLASVQRRAR